MVFGHNYHDNVIYNAFVFQPQKQIRHNLNNINSYQIHNSDSLKNSFWKQRLIIYYLDTVFYLLFHKIPVYRLVRQLIDFINEISFGHLDKTKTKLNPESSKQQ